ncbi:hypothetical protein GCM10023085_45790 [Actinomadura viridis]|uniref:Uncharacterized protein n=1 Tax=Actinomadura viridis TaxID=58110 RepID=A0A931DF26_9ACTN|nr:hypothetical protein [Actinomadura viridis]MBG6089939.1 hypothetical protein [Actinomadura viridis]
MTTATLPLTSIRCQNCPVTFEEPRGRYTLPGADAARAAGWTVWEGNTLGGKQVTRVYCPWCAGREKSEPKWDARCETCDSAASEEDGYAEDPFTIEDAKRWQQDHRCEPYVHLVQPQREQP